MTLVIDKSKSAPCPLSIPSDWEMKNCKYYYKSTEKEYRSSISCPTDMQLAEWRNLADFNAIKDMSSTDKVFTSLDNPDRVSCGDTEVSLKNI